MQSGFSSFIYFAQTTLSASDLGNSAKSMTSSAQNGLMSLIHGKAMPGPACSVASSKLRAQGGVRKLTYGIYIAPSQVGEADRGVMYVA
jgi:hypothetical protein